METIDNAEEPRIVEPKNLFQTILLGMFSFLLLKTISYTTYLFLKDFCFVIETDPSVAFFLFLLGPFTVMFLFTLVLARSMRNRFEAFQVNIRSILSRVILWYLFLNLVQFLYVLFIQPSLQTLEYLNHATKYVIHIQNFRFAPFFNVIDEILVIAIIAIVFMRYGRTAATFS